MEGGFELSQSKATHEVSVDQIFQFIWDNVPMEEIHGIVGFFEDESSRDEVEYFLQDDPNGILYLLETAVSVADALLDDY